MPIFYNASNYELLNNKSPLRIVSLVPSLTQLLFYLGLENNIIGRTKFCIHPKLNVIHVEKIGGTKNINFAKIKSLQPNLIICNKEENNKNDIELLAIDYNVLVTDIKNVDDALNAIAIIGNITNTKIIADELCDLIRIKIEKYSFNQWHHVVYLIWKNPFLTIGGDTFINGMLKLGGFKNEFEILLRYPELTVYQINKSKATHILLSSEPYPFKNKHILELQNLFPTKKLVHVDGEIFSWYGNNMIEAPAYFQQLKLEM
jgi:ABC-type Fe3+-hydroxamate transport system substrate-binding protein